MDTELLVAFGMSLVFAHIFINILVDLSDHYQKKPIKNHVRYIYQSSILVIIALIIALICTLALLGLVQVFKHILGML